MPRPPRIQCPDAIYHVVVRGDNREAIFIDDVDRQAYLGLLRRYKGRFRFLCHAYVLMTNHIHLLLEPTDTATISSIMQALNTMYTRYFNDRYGRVGHLYQGRFHSTLVDKDSYLLEVTRYIHLNPVRAGMVSHPSEYLWSSYQAYASLSREPTRLADRDLVLGMVGPDLQRGMAAYTEFVEDGINAQVPIEDHWSRSPLRAITRKVPDTKLKQGEVPDTIAKGA